MFTIRKSLYLGAAMLLAACVSLPNSPSIMVLPGSNKNFEQFRYDDDECRRYAYAQIGGMTPGHASASSGVGSAAVGAALGAAAGAALGGGEGAAIGAGTGLLAGGLAGSGPSRTSGYEAQHRYDINYIQCMYAKGHRVPITGGFSNEQSAVSPQPTRILPPPPGFTPPPPPPGTPPYPPPQ